MFGLKKMFFYLVGVFVIGAVLSPVAWVGLKVLKGISVLAIVLLPLYGAYRGKKGKEKSKGVKSYLSPILRFFKKVIKINAINFSGFLIIGVVISILFEEIVYTLVRTLLISIITLFVMYVAWEVTRYLLKQFKDLEIPKFKEALFLAF